MRRILSIEVERNGFVVEVFSQKTEEKNSKGNGSYNDPYKRYVFQETDREQMTEFIEKALSNYKMEASENDVFDKAFEEFSKEEDDGDEETE
ncbi:MAG: hypothetical protein E6R04_04215 [Spirochaetes bacterium]|nr:MAG: hypothetical protein E6R04_04215 [Spirochaetota bacterium]